MSDIFEVSTPRLYTPSKPVEDPAYLRFIRSLECCVKGCKKHYGIEAAHTGPRGMGQKSSDRSCIPLCRRHHQADNYSLHKLGPVQFQEHWKLDIAITVAACNIYYDQNIGGKCA